MAMNKTSSGDTPLRQGAVKSFWTLLISGRRRQRIAMCFWKIDRVFRFFPSGGLYRRKAMPEVGQGAETQHTTACCSMQVIDITLAEQPSTRITSLRVVQQKHSRSKYKLVVLLLQTKTCLERNAPQENISSS
jgi:hypothetical protein